MKKIFALLLTAAMVFSLCACGANPTKPGSAPAAEAPAAAAPAAQAAPAGDSLAGTYDIKVWCPEKAVELTQTQIEAFNSSNEDGIVINATIEAVGEGDAASSMITDVEAGGDIFFFPQDQTARLVQAGALAKLGVAAAKIVAEANDPGVVTAAMSGDELFAYPLTSDNGYFMYYDKSVIPEEDIGDLAAIIKDCEDAGKYFSMSLTTDGGWYSVAFFFGAGCVSEWTTDDDGNFIAVNDDFNSEKGLLGAKAMKMLVDSPIYNCSSQASEFEAAIPSAVVISGTWDYVTASEILGENFGCAELPSVTVDGETFHLGSFNGCKLVGVKPQVDVAKQAVLHKLAQFLTSEECQTERFNELAWGPANLAAQASEAVQANEGLAALLAQNVYSKPQGQIAGSWWDIATALCQNIKDAADEDGLKAALQTYKDAVDSLFGKTGYVFVGAWNGWNNADDESAAYMSEGGACWIATVEVEESDYMGGRIVPITSWDTDLGCQQVTVGADLIAEYDAESNPDNNIIFLAPGTYQVVYDVTTGNIEITKVG